MSLKSTRHFSILGSLLLCLTGPVTPVRADISQKQARKAISRIAGFKLPENAVRVRSLSASGDNLAEANAELELVFRLVQNSTGEWRIQDIRAGQDRWEALDLLARAAKFQLPANACRANGLERPNSSLTVKQARCLIADLFNVTLPSDAVRVKEISALDLPIGTETSAIAVTQVQGDFRLRKDAAGWQVLEFKTGNRDWLNLTGFASSLDDVKRLRATEELTAVARALDLYRKDRGSYLAADKHSVLIDHLNPHYLNRVIRVDPWHHPYLYQGERDRFTLRSSGPDGKADTADDVTVSNSSR